MNNTIKKIGSLNCDINETTSFILSDAFTSKNLLMVYLIALISFNLNRMNPKSIKKRLMRIAVFDRNADVPNLRTKTLLVWRSLNR